MQAMSRPARPEGASRRARVDRYELLEELGRGGMGAVFRARDLASGRCVALKLVAESERRPDRLARLLREGELTATLRHPNVVTIHGAGAANGRPYLAYELLEGCRPLDRVWREDGTPLAERVRMIRDAARGLAAAHARGIVHRDVKPDNILVDREGWVRVADFGLATAAGLERLTRTGALVGTPSAMAPEQLEGDRPVTPASDVWALGVTLYFALTDRLPFEGANFLEFAARVARARPTPPRRIEPSVPPELEAVCLKALSERPEARYPDAGAFADDLERALRGESVEASAPGLWKLVRDRPGTLRLVLPLCASLGAAAVALWSLAEEPRSAAGARPAPSLSALRDEGPEPAGPRGDQALAGDLASAGKHGSGETPRRAGEEAAEDEPLFAARTPEERMLLEALEQRIDEEVFASLKDPRARADFLKRRGRLLRKLNPREGYACLKRAGRMGDGEASRLVAEAYRSGEAEAGIARDPVEAVRWYRRGAEQGDLTCLRRLGELLVRGDGVPADPAEGYRLLLRAAEHGDGLAAVHVAQEHRRGRYLPADEQEHRFWRRRALEKGVWEPRDETEARLP
ncbi:MAG: hypothetical protein D6731_25320 [Planctomycetota bacterium]|nr:MAG: hypothetical protein D6731_25320 [Planctomycetota bacterium]